MSKRRRTSTSTTTPATALQPFLNTAELSTLVPALPARTLQRMVTTLGLEDSGSVLVRATGEQLLTLMDADLWRRDSRTGDEHLDPHRFGRWLQVLVDADLASAVARLQELDQDLVIGALAHHIGVGSRTTVERRGLLESVSTWECGSLLVWARLEEAWDAVTAVLAYAQSEHPAWCRQVMAACRDLSYEYLEEASGFDALASRRDQAWQDLADARAERREAQGYVTRHAAHAFLAAARRRTGDDLASLSEARAYLRRSQSTGEWARSDGQRRGPEESGAPARRDATDVEVVRLAQLVDACDGATPVRGLLLGSHADGPATASATVARLAALASRHDPSLEHWQQELGFLSNCLMASGLLPENRASENDAVAAVIATCDLGLASIEGVADQAIDAATPLSVFRRGWSLLHHDVGIAVASALLRSLGQSPLERSEFHDDARSLRLALVRALERDRPWDAAAHLDVIATLDLPTWATLTHLLAEFPVVPLGCLEPSGRAQLRVTKDVEFIASLGHLRWIDAFAGGLTQAVSSS